MQMLSPMPSLLMKSSALLLASLVFSLPLAHAAPDVFLDASTGSAQLQSAPGITANILPPADSPAPAIREADQRKALSFQDKARLLLDTSIDSNQPFSIFVLFRIPPTNGPVDTAKCVILDASGTPFYDVLRVQWSDGTLSVRVGHSFKNDPSGLSVTFAAEETEPFRGQWMFLGLSMQTGKGWACLGGLSSPEVLLKAARVSGAGALPAREKTRFSLGTALNEVKSGNEFLLGQLAIIRSALTPEQLVGLALAVQSGKPLNTSFSPADSAKVAALLDVNKPDLPQPQRQRIETPQMLLEFEDGWLVRWENRETGEKIDFGRPDIKRSTLDDRHYLPGPWWVDWKLPADLEATRTQWASNITQLSPSAVSLQQTATRPGNRQVHAMQWGIQVPYDQVDAIHFPKGMPPSRMSGKDSLGTFVVPSHDLGGRLGELAARGQWRLRFYQIQGRTGGLLIYMDDPDLDHYAALEFKKEPHGLIISNRSICSPPWQNSYTGGKWVIQQYTGYVGAGAQYYQDYLANAFHLTPLKDRPTGWAKKVGLMFVNAPWTNPLPVPGKRRPEYNYSTDWEESIRAGEQWLDNLAKIIDPSQVMIYTVDWRLIPNIDRGLQDYEPDPFFSIMCRKARARGFHVMLHTCAPMLSSDSVTYERFFVAQAKLFGEPNIKGHVFHALKGGWVGGDGKPSAPGGWTIRSGYNRPAFDIGMNPAFEGYRYILASSIVSALRATGADAVHLDVPNAEIDLRSAEYGMNGLQGYRAFGKLLRTLLDESGLQNVAIGTEVTPSEALLPYVDFAQTTRGKSIQGFVDGIATGKYTMSEENMIVGQSGAELEKLKKLREAMDAGQFAGKFNAEFTRAFLRKMRELGEPNINSMVIAPYVQAMPHLGQTNNYAGKRDNPDDVLENQIVDSLTSWSALQHDTPPFFGATWSMFMDVPPYDQLDVIQRYRREGYADPAKSIRKNGRFLNQFDYGKLALARFWADQTPQTLPPAKWARSDIALYSLKDGRQLRIFRADPQTLRLAFSTGETLAEIDLFTGWKNAAPLIDKYQPLWLKNQIDEYFQAPAAPAGVSKDASAAR